MSSKKKKRLEKYIEKKLKKEARGDLFKKLEEQAWSSDLLKSSRTLGQNKETMKQKLRRALNEQRQGLDQSDKNVPLFVRTKGDYDDDEGDDDSDSDEDSNDVDMDMPASFSPAPVAKPATPVVAGSALKVGSSILVRKSTGKKPVRRPTPFCHYCFSRTLLLKNFVSPFLLSVIFFVVTFGASSSTKGAGKAGRPRKLVRQLRLRKRLIFR